MFLPTYRTTSGDDLVCSRLTSRSSMIHDHAEGCAACAALDRSGLSTRTIYSTPWHKPFIEQFSKTYGRSRPVGLDLV